jgi:hypothetical protein
MAEREWDDALKAEVIEAYQDADPTEENTLDIVAELADRFEKTQNGIRIVLSRAGAYVKKNPATSTPKKEGTSTRVNKAEAISNFKKAIEAAGKEVDNDICDRLTGKAAVYLTGLLG